MVEQLFLSDGRTLEYALGGDTSASSVEPPPLFLNGSPGSSKPLLSIEQACKKKGVRLITYSRPGYQGSTLHKGRSVADAATDIATLMAHLKHDEYVVAGWSGGGPHALAAAALLPQCKAATVIACIAPYENVEHFTEGMMQSNVTLFNTATKGEAALEPVCSAMRTQVARVEPEAFAQFLTSTLPPVDLAVVANNPSFGVFCAEQVQEGLASGCDGLVDDFLSFVKPWGFDVSTEVHIPIFVYAGREDLSVPFAHGEWLAKQLCKRDEDVHLDQGQGHLSIVAGREEDMVEELLAACR